MINAPYLSIFGSGVAVGLGGTIVGQYSAYAPRQHEDLGPKDGRMVENLASSCMVWTRCSCQGPTTKNQKLAGHDDNSESKCQRWFINHTCKQIADAGVGIGVPALVHQS